MLALLTAGLVSNPRAIGRAAASHVGGAVTFSFTGGQQQWVVPPGVSFVSVDASGAQGGSNAQRAQPGGRGGRVQSIVPVTPGETLHVYVGGMPTAQSYVAGFNGGGGAGDTGGGGASDIRRGGAGLANRILVAGGGGGHGQSYYPGGGGGDGGGLTGSPGQWAGTYGGGAPGGGGTQASGGTGGAGDPGEAGSTGSLGAGGAGGGRVAGGGGGGGGYFGGGGGAGVYNGYYLGFGGGGGGGGSSFTGTSVVDAVHAPGHRLGNGLVTITPGQHPLQSGPITATEQLGGGSPSQRCIQRCEAGDPVDLATGNFWEAFDDLSVPGRGPGLGFTRTYNSTPSPGAPTDGPLGFGWSHNYDMSLSTDAASATVKEEGGSKVAFSASGSNYVPAPRVLATLVHNGDGTWTFTRRAKEIFVFDAGGRLSSIGDRNGYTTTLAYTGAQLSTVTDSAGRTLTLAWSGGRIATVSDQASPPRTVSFQYLDGSGNLTDAIDPAGGHWQFGYGANHRMATMRKPKYYADTTTSPTPVTTNHYDAEGRVDWQDDPLGRRSTFDYSSIPGATKVTNPKGNVGVTRFQDGVPVAHTTAYGTAQAATSTFAFDPATGGRIATVDPNGRVWQRRYDAAGNVTSTSDPVGRTTQASYTVLNDPQTVIDAFGVTTTRTYDPAGNLLSESTPLVGSSPAVARTTTFTYADAAHPGDVTSITDPDAKVWAQSYDVSGNLATSTDPLNNTSRSCYDTVGRRTRAIAPKGTAAGVTCATSNPTYTTIFLTSDAFGAPLSVRDPLGHETLYSYDLNRNPRTMVDAKGQTSTYTYDPADQLIQVLRPDATTVRRDHHPDGSLWHAYDGAGQATTYGYDAAGRLTSLTDPMGRTAAYGYDPAGNRTTTQDPGGNCAAIPKLACTTTAYDAANQPVGVDYSDSATPDVTMSYDAAGRRSSMTDGTGTSTWTWDSLGRLTSSTDGASQTLGYGHDLRGNVTSIAYPGGAGTVVRTYDDAANLWKVRDWLGHESVFGYDADSSLTTQAYPNATTATYTPDAAGRLMDVSHAPTATPNSPFARFSYRRDDTGQLSSVSSAGVSSESASYTYTPLDQLKSAGTEQYRYDSAENLTRRGAGAWQTFDATNQLATTAAAPAATAIGSSGDSPGPADYDGDGKADLAVFGTTGQWSIHRSSDETEVALTYGTSGDIPVPRDYDGDNKADVAVFRPSTGAWYVLQSSNNAGTAVTYGGISGDIPVPANYDADAKADLSIYRPGSSGAWYVQASTIVSFGYDAKGDRISLTPPSGSASTYGYDQANRLTTAPGASYTYSGDALRSSKTVSGATTAFTWDRSAGPAQMLAESSPTGTYRYVYGPDGLPLERIDASNNVVYYHHDQLGSTRAITNAAGAVVAGYTYDPYGKLTASTGSLTQPFGFAGQYTDAETGFQYLRARYYDPATGQFITRDPLVAQSGQPYAYANNSPLNFTDPSGEIAWFAAAAVVWAGFEVGSAVVDGYSTVKTIADPCASGWDKASNVGLFALGVFGPGGGYSTGARVAVKTPVVRDPKLSNHIGQLYKHANRPGTIGNGTTMDVVRHELANGLTKHVQKSEGHARGLRNWLANNPGASYEDRLVAQSLYDELVDALGYVP